MKSEHEIITYHSKKTEEEVLTLRNFVKKIEGDFFPPLSEKVDLDEYIDKMVEFSEIIISKVDGEFAGFLSFYANDHINHKAHLTSYAVEPKFRRGFRIAPLLMAKCIEVGRDAGMTSLRAEIDPKHRRAIMIASRFKPKMTYPEPGSDQKNIIVDLIIEPKKDDTDKI